MRLEFHPEAALELMEAATPEPSAWLLEVEN